MFLLAPVFDLDVGLATLVETFKRNVPKIGLHLRVTELAAKKTFDTENTKELTSMKMIVQCESLHEVTHVLHGFMAT
jgi:hypothetical protein